MTRMMDVTSVVTYVGPRKAMMDVLGSDEDALEAALGLGELAGLTVTNEADAYDVSIADRQFLVPLYCMLCYSFVAT